jgi:hypothetical protein
MRTISAVAAWNGEEFRCAGATLVELSGGDAQETDPANLRTMVVLQDVTGPKLPLVRNASSGGSQPEAAFDTKDGNRKLAASARFLRDFLQSRHLVTWEG